MAIFLNADVGEGAPCDAELIPLVGGVNISCGAHAGEVTDQVSAIRTALEHHCRIGAHPGYPDPDNFGRKEMDLSSSALSSSLRSQLDHLDALIRAEGAQLTYIKPHGALYNQMAREECFARQVLETFALWRELPVMVLANSAAERSAQELGVPFIREGFLDRAYTAEGLLVPRDQPGAVITEVHQAQAQAQAFLHNQPVRAITGEEIRLPVESLCVHGDTPHAVAFLRAILGR